MHENLDPECLHIYFEDLVYKYESVKEMLKKRFNLGNHIHPQKYFNPKVSVNNTQLFKRYPEFSKDISIIENELHDYLYDYEKYGDIKFTGKSF